MLSQQRDSQYYLPIIIAWCGYHGIIRGLSWETFPDAPANWHSSSGLPKVVNDTDHQIGDAKALALAGDTVTDDKCGSETETAKTILCPCTMPMDMTEKTSDVLCVRNVWFRRKSFMLRSNTLRCDLHWKCKRAGSSRAWRVRARSWSRQVESLVAH